MGIKRVHNFLAVFVDETVDFCGNSINSPSRGEVNSMLRKPPTIEAVEEIFDRDVLERLKPKVLDDVDTDIAM